MTAEPTERRPSCRCSTSTGWSGRLDELHAAYQSAAPYPHIVLDDFLEPGVAEAAIEEFPPLDPDQWNNYLHANERKFSNTDPDTWGPTLQAILDELNSPRFVEFVGKLIGVDDLIADPSLEGGGLHQSTTGGFLNIHADFTVHPHNRKWQRRANMLLYLNEDWKPEYGGDLELWSADMKECVEKVSPVANRVLIFTTDATSFHGHPEPMRCPEGVARRSLALYYFTVEEDPARPLHRVPGPAGRRGPLDHDLRRQADAAGLRLGQAPPGPLRPDGQQDPRLPRPAPATRSQGLVVAVPTIAAPPGSRRPRRRNHRRSGTAASALAGRAEPAPVHHRRGRRHRGRGRAVPVAPVGPVVGRLNPLRAVPYDNFYDLQARAMFHGHLDLPNGPMGIEAFVHDGRDYTYFGIFPSLLRMPILLVTNSLRRRAHRSVDPAGLADHRVFTLADAVAPADPHAGAGPGRDGSRRLPTACSWPPSWAGR